MWRQELKGDAIGTVFSGEDLKTLDITGGAAVHKVGEGSKRDSAEHSAQPLFLSRRPAAVEHREDALPEAFERPLPLSEVVDEKVRDLVGEGEALDIRRVGAIKEDKAMATPRNETCFKGPITGRALKRDASLLEPESDIQESEPRELDEDEGQGPGY